MENATIAKNLVPVRHSEREGFDWLTVDCPDGWDDVKKICKKVLAYNGKNYVFRGWNSDRNEAFFHASTEFARIVAK